MVSNNYQGFKIRFDAWPLDLVIVDEEIAIKDRRRVLPMIMVKKRTFKIIFLTQIDPDKRIHWIELGADDVLPRPFHPAELANKIELLIFPLNTLKEAHTIRRGYYELDTYENSLTINGYKVFLSQKQTLLAHYFLTNEGLRPLEEISKMFATNGYPSDQNSVRVAMTLLKKKIRQETSFEMIRCRRGLGFYLLGSQ